MPRLSVIIPHRRNDQRLEATLLSVLENRPSDTEVIVAHDGSYSDPYQLTDEVLFVEVDSGSSDVELFQAGIMAACAPVVNTLIDGVRVSEGWFAPALEAFGDRRELFSVALRIETAAGAFYGIDFAALDSTSKMLSGNIYARKAESFCAGAQLSCGFFSRTTLLALQGLNCAYKNCLSAELDLALAADALELDSICDQQSTVQLVEPLEATSPADCFELARVAVEHQQVASGIVSALTRAPLLLLQRPQAALRTCRGLLQRSSTHQQLRIEAAAAQLANRSEQVESRRSSESSSPIHRRAA